MRVKYELTMTETKDYTLYNYLLLFTLVYLLFLKIKLNKVRLNMWQKAFSL